MSHLLRKSWVWSLGECLPSLVPVLDKLAHLFGFCLGG